MKKFNCQFKNCTCLHYVNAKLCNTCNHSHIWHSKISNYSFVKPKYVSNVIFGQIHIFKPLPLAPTIEVANPCFCPCT